MTKLPRELGHRELGPRELGPREQTQKLPFNGSSDRSVGRFLI
jgi:hypothetical protein